MNLQNRIKEMNRMWSIKQMKNEADRLDAGYKKMYKDHSMDSDISNPNSLQVINSPVTIVHYKYAFSFDHHYK